MFEINQLQKIAPVEESPAQPEDDIKARQARIPASPNYPRFPNSSPIVPPPSHSRSQSNEQSNEQNIHGRKQQVIEASRRKYGRSREEVERLVYEQLGVSPIPKVSPDQQELKTRLLNAGVDEEGAQYLLEHYDPARIIRQLHWLPQRAARNPAALLFAAIENDYEAPRTVRQRAGGTAKQP